jgi:HD-GYP domain-containing protein (c-di-GMP phosphodiesterase class II)
MASADSCFEHTDALALLDSSQPLERKLAAIHEALYAQVDIVDRIAVAAYDAPSDTLRTFLASSPGGSQLVRYEARLADAPSLAEILRVGRPRVVNDLAIFRGGRHLHTRVIAEERYRASYTVPTYLNAAFSGFIFFNSRTAMAFTEEALRILDVYAHLVSAVVAADMFALRVLAAAVKTAHELVSFRDPETGAHLERMARYARLIAQHLAASGAASLDDEAIERISQFAPLHDLGKLALPDRILHKPGPLTAEERDEMQRHTLRGREMIDAIARNFGLEQLEGLDLLRHIAESHHETMDGRGYPRGLKDGSIPLAARIVAVADVFDALTSPRPYKASWSNAEAFAWLRRLARSKLDEDCVDALAFNAGKVTDIQSRYADPSSKNL